MIKINDLKEYKNIYYLSFVIVLFISLLLTIFLWSDLRYLISFLTGGIIAIINFTLIIKNVLKMPLQDRLETVKMLRVNRLIRTIIYGLGLLIVIPLKEPRLALVVFAAYFVVKVAIILENKFIRRKDE